MGVACIRVAPVVASPAVAPMTAIVPPPRARLTAALAGLPPYVFAALAQLKHAARARGHAFTDLGIGSPNRRWARGDTRSHP